jgi:hypothetical protein
LLVVNNCAAGLWLSVAVLKPELWSAGVLGQAWNIFDFFLPTLHPSPEKNRDLRQYSSTPVKKKHPRQIKPDAYLPAYASHGRRVCKNLWLI